MHYPELQFPHEDLEGMIAATDFHAGAAAKSLLGFAALGVVSKTGELGIVHTDVPFRWASARQFEVYVGHKTGAELGDKRQFGDMLHELGYAAPHSAVYYPGDDLDEMMAQAVALDPATEGRFLKPVSGSRAKGTMQAENPKQAVMLAQAQGRPYLIQTVEPTDHELRYVLHRDSEAVRQDAPHNWRIAFRKLRPSVTGDGEHMLADLVAANQAMPWYSRAKYWLHRGGDGRRVPALNEHVELAVGGTIGATFPTEQELHNLDTFMHGLVTELEAKIGRTLATVCFDVGVRNADTLTGAYDSEKLHDQLVFYEFQVPFGYTSYVTAAPKPASESPLLYRGKLYNAIMRSLLASAHAERGRS
jgi:hypothetical protein